MNARQQLALEHFDSFYPEFMRAIEDEDALALGALVERRQAAIDDIVAAFAGGFLPESVRNHIEGTEATIQIRLSRFYDSLLLRMASEQRFAFAVGRYEESAR